MKNVNKVQKTQDGTHFQNSKVESIFKLVRMPDKKVHIIVGHSIMSKLSFKTFKQADEYISQKPYELLINICCLILSSQINENKETKENPQNIETDK